MKLKLRQLASGLIAGILLGLTLQVAAHAHEFETTYTSEQTDELLQQAHASLLGDGVPQNYHVAGLLFLKVLERDPNHTEARYQYSMLVNYNKIDRKYLETQRLPFQNEEEELTRLAEAGYPPAMIWLAREIHYYGHLRYRETPHFERVDRVRVYTLSELAILYSELGLPGALEKTEFYGNNLQFARKIRRHVEQAEGGMRHYQLHEAQSIVAQKYSQALYDHNIDREYPITEKELGIDIHPQNY